MGGEERSWAVDGGAVLALLLFAANASGQAPAIDVTAYTFSIRIPDTGSVISAVAGITYRGGSHGLLLNLAGLTVDSVRVAQRAIPYNYDGQIIQITAPPPASDGPVEVFYHGAPRDGLIIQTNARGRRSAFGDNWPERARAWLPTVDAPRDKATVRFTVSAPSGWRVVGNGTAGTCERTCTWSEARPIPTYTMVLGAGTFSVSRHRPIVHGTDTIPITVWTYPEDSAFADSGPFRRATEIVETMERLVGPFPYEKLAHVESSTRYGGMENSSAIFYAEKPYVERTMREGVVRHETSHQWFGDAVTEREWAHLWLSEGFASYFDLVIGAALDGDSVLAAGVARDARAYFASKVVDRPLVDTAEHDPNKLLNENSYQKGAWVLHMLRGSIGDSAFFRGIREYYRVYRDSTALSNDFQRVMEQAAGRSLDAFFQQWLWQPGYPRLAVRWRYEAADRRVRLEITQAQPESWGVFRLPRLVIEAVSGVGAPIRRVYALDGRTTIAYLELDAAPSAIHVDPDGRLLVQSTVTP
jgi:aminopeptidase N